MTVGKTTSIWIGPEIVWLFCYGLVWAIIKYTHSPAKNMDSFWVSMAYVVPLVVMPLTFGLFYLPVVVKPWLILRLWIAGLIGCHLVLSRCMLAYTEQGPGIGTAYIMGMSIALFVLIVCTIWAVIRF